MNCCLTIVIEIWLLGCFLSKITGISVVRLDLDWRFLGGNFWFSSKLCLRRPKIWILILIRSWAECKMTDWHANEQESKPRTRLHFPESVGFWAQTQGQAKVNGLWYREVSWVPALPSSCQQLPSVLSKSENQQANQRLDVQNRFLHCGEVFVSLLWLLYHLNRDTWSLWIVQCNFS